MINHILHALGNIINTLSFFGNYLLFIMSKVFVIDKKFTKIKSTEIYISNYNERVMKFLTE